MIVSIISSGVFLWSSCFSAIKSYLMVYKYLSVKIINLSFSLSQKLILKNHNKLNWIIIVKYILHYRCRHTLLKANILGFLHHLQIIIRSYILQLLMRSNHYENKNSLWHFLRTRGPMQANWVLLYNKQWS